MGAESIHYLDGTEPVVRPDGRRLVEHAPAISYAEGARLWEERNEKLKELGRDNYQIFVIPHREDVTRKILADNSRAFSGKFPTATSKTEIFPDKEDLPWIINESPEARHLYIISSPISKSGLVDIQRNACHYKDTLQARYITLIAPYFLGTRQDKNVNKNGEYVPTPINIDAYIAGLSYIDGFMLIEPHSFATQSAAAKIGKPLFPITPWNYAMDCVLKRPIQTDGQEINLNRDNTVIVRPDEGRNIAATRTAGHYGFDSVSFEKTRQSASQVEFKLLNPEDQRRIKDKICVCYDDELATCGTICTLADNLQRYGAIGLIIVGVHGKFTEKWEEKIKHPLIKKIFITNSRPPIGKIRPYIESGKIEVISLEGLIADILATDVQGINFWKDPKYSHMVLQENDKE